MLVASPENEVPFSSLHIGAIQSSRNNGSNVSKDQEQSLLGNHPPFQGRQGGAAARETLKWLETK